ncbi:phosphatase PAP2 family protein [Hathewaya massiliensis]|uniref:phosphatase PAP2 family protein n=1 Tax=Hathewaya massiliensis TaxID=1964382 RepID=UPI001FAA9679|nr:phosphatase PAP2 family protein [Hathewaya massiliensis]
MNSILNSLKKRDERVLRFFNDYIKCNELDFLMPKITYLGSIPFSYIFCAALLCIPNKTTRNIGLKCSISLVISSIVAIIIKKTINRERPFLILKNLNIKKIHIDAYSFPSGHTTMAFSIGIMLSLCLPHLDYIFILLSLAVGISRMYIGVHYPTDVIMGMIIGTLCSYATYYFIL